MRSLARMEQLFSDKIQDFPTDLKWTQSSEIMCYLPPVMYGVFDNSGNHSLNGQQLDTLDRYNHFTTKIWPLGPKQLLILPKFCLPLFISFFEDRNFGVTSNKTLVDLLTIKCKEQILFYECACATVIQPKTGVLNLLSWTPSRVW